MVQSVPAIFLLHGGQPQQRFLVGQDVPTDLFSRGPALSKSVQQIILNLKGQGNVDAKGVPRLHAFF